MAKNPGDLSEAESKRKLDRMLRGAFAGSPTPLKDIPKKGGESRAKKKRKKKPGK